jgi:hypothetical protein
LPKRFKLAHACLREYSYARLQSAQLLGQLGVFLTSVKTWLSTQAAPRSLAVGGTFILTENDSNGNKVTV